MNQYYEQCERARRLAKRLALEVIYIAAEGKILNGATTESLCISRFEYEIMQALDSERAMTRYEDRLIAEAEEGSKK